MAISKGITEGTFHYPNGLSFDINSKNVDTHIWPESPFAWSYGSIESNSSYIYRTGHDTISQEEPNLHTTNKPVCAYK